MDTELLPSTYGISSSCTKRVAAIQKPSRNTMMHCTLVPRIAVKRPLAARQSQRIGPATTARIGRERGPVCALRQPLARGPAATSQPRLVTWATVEVAFESRVVFAPLYHRSLLRQIRRQRRDGGGVRGDSAMQFANDQQAPEVHDFDALCGPAVTPKTAEELRYVIQRGFPELVEHNLETIALDRAANYTDAEIAERHGMSLRSVQRKLKLIRSILTRVVEE